MKNLVNVKKLLNRIFGDTEKIIEDFEKKYDEEKKQECMELYNAIVDVLVQKKATIQNTLFVLKMVEYGFLRAKYEELVKGTVIIPEGNIPLSLDKTVRTSEGSK